MNPNGSEADALVTRAEDALRRSTIPPGPGDAVAARTLAALRAADDRPEPRRRLRQLLRVAALLLLPLGGLLFLGDLLRPAPALAFAEVAEKLRDAHTLVYSLSVESPQMKNPMTVKVSLKETGWMRIEEPAGGASVSRAGRVRSMTLNPVGKTAVIMDVKKGSQPMEPAPADPSLLAEELRRLVGKEGRPVGKKRIGAVEAQGFRVEKLPQEPFGREFLIWADPATKFPLQVEMSLPGGTRATMSDFRLDVPLDDAVFRLEPPEGFKVETLSLEQLTPEGTVVRLLREYALTAKGEFPPRIDDPAALGKHFRKVNGDKKTDKPDQKEMQRTLDVTQVYVYSNTLFKGYGYQPDGVKLGEAGRVLFWYRPAKAEKYRVLHGDLNWTDEPAERLPGRSKP